MQRAIVDELKLPMRGREDLVDAEILQNHLRVEQLLDLDLERRVSNRGERSGRGTRERKRWREGSERGPHSRAAGFGRSAESDLSGWVESRSGVASIERKESEEGNTSTSEIGMETSIWLVKQSTTTSFKSFSETTTSLFEGEIYKKSTKRKERKTVLNRIIITAT